MKLLQALFDVLWVLWRIYTGEHVTVPRGPPATDVVPKPDTIRFRRWLPYGEEEYLANVAKATAKKKLWEPTPRLKWKKGTVVTCPTCKTKIATARRDIYAHDVRSFDVWEWHIPASVGMKLECPVDGSRLLRNYDGREHFHTERGWIG